MGLTVGKGLGLGFKKGIIEDVTPEFSNVVISAIDDTTFTITLTVNPKGAATTISIEYGTTIAYGLEQAVVTGSPIAATGEVSAVLSGLTQNQLYNFRVKAVRAGVTTYSNNYTQSTANNRYIMSVAGIPSGTATAGTMNVTCTEDVTPTVTGDVTLSTTRVADGAYRRHTITVNCPNNGSGTIIFPDRSKIVAFGNHNGASTPTVAFYAGTDTTMPRITLNLGDLPATLQKWRSNAAQTNSLKTTGGSFALPAALTYLYWEAGANFTWTYNGALPSGLTFIYLRSTSGALGWTYSGAMPTGLTFILLESPAHEVTSLDFSGGSAITVFTLNDWRVTKITSADMVTLLNNLAARVGNLPATLTIKDYVDAAAPPQAVTDAVAALKVAKPTVTTVTFAA